MTLLRLQPLNHPRHRARRLVCLVLAGLALLLLSLWDPIGTPGPIVCTCRRAFGIPCPFCGMTRGASLCLRGQLLAATIYNPLTVPIFLFGLALMVVWAIEYAGNVRFALDLSPFRRRLLLAFVLVIVLAAWVYMLMYRREDDFATSWLGMLLRLFW
jgi:hypothetical protein